MTPVLEFNGSGPQVLKNPDGSAPSGDDDPTAMTITTPQAGPPVPIHPSGTPESLRDEVLQPYSLTVPPGVQVSRS